MLRDYIELTKPRMALANTIVAMAVYAFASHGHMTWETALLLVGGMFLSVAGGCVLNNIYDKDIDAKMARTKDRVLVAGRIDINTAMVFGAFLCALGLKLLWLINPLTLITGLIGAVMYVFVYTPIKHTSGLALIPGAIAGAMPPLVGYVAATDTLDLLAWLLFSAMFLWQIPHFLAIARYRYDEYTAANVPLLVVRPQSEAARLQARRIFRISLGLLLAVCAALVVIGYFV